MYTRQTAHFSSVAYVTLYNRLYPKTKAKERTIKNAFLNTNTGKSSQNVCHSKFLFSKEWSGKKFATIFYLVMQKNPCHVGKVLKTCTQLRYLRKFWRSYLRDCIRSILSKGSWRLSCHRFWEKWGLDEIDSKRQSEIGFWNRKVDRI